MILVNNSEHGALWELELNYHFVILKFFVLNVDVGVFEHNQGQLISLLEYHHAHQMGVIEIIGITCLQHWKDWWLTWLLVWPKQCPYSNYCNPSLGLTTKARSCKGASQKWSLGVTLHALESVGEWRNELSHSQMSSHFGSGSPNGLPNFQRAIVGVKLIGLKSPLHHWKALGT